MIFSKFGKMEWCNVECWIIRMMGYCGIGVLGYWGIGGMGELNVGMMGLRGVWVMGGNAVELSSRRLSENANYKREIINF